MSSEGRISVIFMLRNSSRVYPYCLSAAALTSRNSNVSRSHTYIARGLVENRSSKFGSQPPKRLFGEESLAITPGLRWRGPRSTLETDLSERAVGVLIGIG